MVICLERGADLHTAQLMPLPLTISCFSKIKIGFTFLLPAHPGSPGQRAVKRVCVCVLLLVFSIDVHFLQVKENPLEGKVKHILTWRWKHQPKDTDELDHTHSPQKQVFCCVMSAWNCHKMSTTTADSC